MSRADGPVAYKVGGYTITHHVASGISKASFDTGVSFSYLMAQAGRESSFRPEAIARDSSATGLFQFTEQTWLEMLRRHGSTYGLDSVTSEIYRGPDGLLTAKNPDTLSRLLNMRKDPNLSALMAGEYAKNNKTVLEQALGRKVGDTDLYIAHFLGTAGAKNILQAKASNPGQPAVDVTPNAAGQNPNFFFTPDNKARSVAQFYERINQALSHPMRTYATFENEPSLQKRLQEAAPDSDWPFETTPLSSVAAASPDKASTTLSVAESVVKPQQQAFSPPSKPEQGNRRVNAVRVERSMPPPPAPSHTALMPQPPDEIAPTWPFETAAWSAKTQPPVAAPPESSFASREPLNAALAPKAENIEIGTASFLVSALWTDADDAGKSLSSLTNLTFPTSSASMMERETFSLNAPPAKIIDQITAYHASSSLSESQTLTETADNAPLHGQNNDGVRRVDMPMPPPATRIENEKKISALDQMLQSVRRTLLR